MKNKFIKPEAEILTFLCDSTHLAADSVNQDPVLGRGYKGTNSKGELPSGGLYNNAENTPGGDLGVPYQY
jgi:hypothetical protein